MKLPIDEVIPGLQAALAGNNSAVLVAEPGAGKTTRVPLALLDEPWLKGQGIIMLEPRRLAARSAAAYMARQLGEQVGETVGYRIRLDSRVSQRTRITVVTEGILTRMLQADQALTGIGLVIFDEFHERSLHADLGLALTLQSQGILREDLRILVMSATLSAEPVAKLLHEAPVIRSQGRSFPVETVYLSSPTREGVEVLMADTIRTALAKEEGSILAFLPGIREIRRVQAALSGRIPGDVDLVPLYGGMPQQLQAEAIQAPKSGRRKVVLATSIAESSLTVEGVRVVIDSGLRRTEQFSARTGMGRLVTVRAARDSADQRRGRAGRTAPGVCYRLWTEPEDKQLAGKTAPEILEADLSSVALELAVWGVKEPAELSWLDEPGEAAFNYARQLLEQLSALEEAGVITAHGRQMAALGLHPRLAHMLLISAGIGYGRLACYLAALLEERDIFPRSQQGLDADLRPRLEVLVREAARKGAPSGSGDLRGAGPQDVQRLLTRARQWASRLPGHEGEDEVAVEAVDELCGLMLSFAYPDRIAQRRTDGRYLLRSGRGAAVAGDKSVFREQYLVAAEVDDDGPETAVQLAAPLTEEQLNEYYKEEMTKHLEIRWDDSTGSVRAKSQLKLGAIIVRENSNVQPTEEQIQHALLDAIKDGGIALLPWNSKSRQLQARIRFMKEHGRGDWPDVSDTALEREVHEWLAPYIAGFRRKSDLQRLNLHAVLESLLNWEQRQELDREAPTHITVPSGSRIPVQYEGPQAPYVSVRLQELFGLMDTPLLAYGRAAVTMHILSPASRPVQVTSDLRSFWESTYFDVKKDLKGRYPKHYWPDNPFEATATRRVRPQGGHK
ncbi:ATP-dependent helicase HrpB [Paenibacillus tuaregi]|uniref:ATP-dependent helicase HrpB n=1 Tax=Paenibacillus tuaregi TaxID=1816681 RepID=UPI00083898DF|nr:ATP-dependent helicase HrpB [Paenibacillus tuaregi]